MGSRYAVDDSKWEEVRAINGYAVFMGYLMVGVRGLGVLVLTWTTVVLLGGFVSDLGKDFWCLTLIALVQTAGVFNFLLKEKLIDMVHAWWGLFVTAFTVVFNGDKEGELEGITKVITYTLAGIQGILISIILCPIVVLYMLGLYTSAGVSLWRLVESDFSNAGGSNQKPALQVLYSLAVAQGMFFGYMAINALGTRSRLAKLVADHGMVDKELVAEYLEETVAGCEKDPSFANGRNLVTYGVDLMKEAKSNEGFIAGIKVLGGAIKDNYHQRDRKVLAKHLLTRSDCSSHMVQRLVQTVGPISPYSREIREHAARILALVARGIRLEQFPGMIECLSSILDTSQECNQQDHQFDWAQQRYGDNNKLKDYQRVELLEKYELNYLIYYRKSAPDFSLSSLIRQLVRCFPVKRKSMGNGGQKSRRENTVHGFDGLLTEAVSVIHQLAVHEDNRRIIIPTCVSNTMLHKIAMALRKLHTDNHSACHANQRSELQMLEKGWVLTEWLGPAVKETNSPTLVGGRRRGQEIEEVVGDGEEEHLLQSRVGFTLGNEVINAIKSTIKSIFDCLDCRATHKKQGIQILLHLSLDMSFIMDSESRRRRLTWILLLIFRSRYDDSEYWMISGFTDLNKNCRNFDGIMRLAGEKLSDLLHENHVLPLEKSERDLQSVHIAVSDLARAFDDDTEDISSRTHATIIMERLCVYYAHSHFAREVEGMLVAMIPKVVKETLVHSASTSTREERQAQATNDGVLQDDQDVYTGNQRLRKALVSLCKDGYMEDDDSLGPKFKEIASKICRRQGKSFKYLKSLLV